ncbi:MAG: hypothetical protein H0T89_02780 [Deltaproteobacteria bacterium]|nr:hypothetical protein [Deltaproteobacteria bacterium]MDQ3298536.1 hypothetical protein [Myxococcota bacterium]
MGNGDDKHGRATRELDRDTLTKLTREASASDVVEWDDIADGKSEELPITSRAATVHDPLTMALLAEVARNSQTAEIDPSKIEAALREALADPADNARPELEHDTVLEPHIKRRRS